MKIFLSENEWNKTLGNLSCCQKCLFIHAFSQKQSVSGGFTKRCSENTDQIYSWKAFFMSKLGNSSSRIFNKGGLSDCAYSYHFFILLILRAILATETNSKYRFYGKRWMKLGKKLKDFKILQKILFKKLRKKCSIVFVIET